MCRVYLILTLILFALCAPAIVAQADGNEQAGVPLRIAPSPGINWNPLIAATMPCRCVHKRANCEKSCRSLLRAGKLRL